MNSTKTFTREWMLSWIGIPRVDVRAERERRNKPPTYRPRAEEVPNKSRREPCHEQI
jgi:hypothetical protein